MNSCMGPLLTRQLIQGAVLEGDHSILPIVEATVVNPKESSLKLNATIFLDTGASLSLIRNDTAAALGLNGTATTVTMGKIGGHEETFVTKIYTLLVQAVDKGPRYKVKALGIPKICSDIENMDTRSYAEQFKLDPEKLRRGQGGEPDILIGVDHPKFHASPTSVKGSIGVKFSILGPVIFGTEQIYENKQKSEIICLQQLRHSSDVDLTDFWATEQIGRAHV